MGIETNTTWGSLVALFSTHELSFEEARKRLLFGAFCLISSFMMLIIGAFHLTAASYLEGTLNTLIALILLSSLVLSRRHRDARAFYRVPPIAVGLLFIVLATLGDATGYRVLWLYAYPPMVLFLLGTREGMAYVAIVTTAWLCALLIPSPISGPAVYDPALTSRFIGSYGLVVAASWFLEAVRGFYAQSMKAHNTQLEQDHRYMHDLAFSDELTQLPNRRAAMHMLDDTLAAMSFDDSKTALVGMLDIDRFKVINDHFGHKVGDQVLRSVARRVRNAVRANDFVGRYGGEEFLLIVPGAKADQYQPILDKIRRSVCQRPISVEGVLHHVTVSIGATNAEYELGAEALIDQADQALYFAKQSGRNRCVIFHEELDANQTTVTVAS